VNRLLAGAVFVPNTILVASDEVLQQWHRVSAYDVREEMLSFLVYFLYTRRVQLDNLWPHAAWRGHVE
jgi:hypothetical protein